MNYCQQFPVVRLHSSAVSLSISFQKTFTNTDKINSGIYNSHVTQVSTKYLGNLSSSYYDISVWTKEVHVSIIINMDKTYSLHMFICVMNPGRDTTMWQWSQESCQFNNILRI